MEGGTLSAPSVVPAGAIVIIESVQAVIPLGVGVSGVFEYLSAFIAFSFTGGWSK